MIIIFALEEVVDSINHQVMDPIFGQMDTIQEVGINLRLCVAKEHDWHMTTIILGGFIRVGDYPVNYL